jgi:hypothetical protein
VGPPADFKPGQHFVHFLFGESDFRLQIRIPERRTRPPTPPKKLQKIFAIFGSIRFGRWRWRRGFRSIGLKRCGFGSLAFDIPDEAAFRVRVVVSALWRRIIRSGRRSMVG